MIGNSHRELLLVIILGQSHVEALYSSISKRIVVNVTTDFFCTFELSYSETEVDLWESFVFCDPYEPTGITNVDVTLSAPNGFEFSGVININPTEILSMKIDNAIQSPAEFTDADASPDEIEFKEIFNNVTDEELPDYKHACGVDPVYEEFKEGARRNRSYVSSDPVKFWTDAVVPWSFVSNGDSFKKYSVYENANIGLPEAEVRSVMKAMKAIEAVSCVRFNLVKPQKDSNWLLVSRESRYPDRTCMINYIKQNLVGRNVANLGDLFAKGKWRRDGDCFGGAYAYYGMDSPQNFVISKSNVDRGHAADISLIVHELLHNLALGHTQKRQDALEHIYVNYGNIQESSHLQYKQCFEKEDPTCDHLNYNDYDTPYDCMSIMHYRDTFFITSAARRAGQKTMRPRRSGCDLSSPNSRMTAADKAILNKVYCSNKPQKKEVASPNYPSNYPDNQDTTYPVSVEAGKKIKLSFTEFKIEADSSCKYDWVEVVDNDGTILLEKSCGMTKPKEIISRTNKLVVKFHSDQNTNFKGFHATYEAVSSAPTPVDGGWSQWSSWGKCGNNKDGKSTCRKKKVRYCTDPAPLNGGKPCPGKSEMLEDCVSEQTDPAKNPSCVLQGGWSAWSDPSACNSGCKSTKTRTCTNPKPVNAKECEGEASETSDCTGGDCASTGTGVIQSTNYPSNYPSKDDLRFPLEVAAGSTIQLTFQDFAVEADPSCQYDYVQVLDTDGSSKAKLCGESVPSPIRSSGNKMTVLFRSDQSVVKKGFKATWTARSGTPSGEVTSPNYPAKYPNNKVEVKTITVPEGKKIELTFTYFAIEFYKEGGKISCPYDKLELFDGKDTTEDKTTHTLCGFELSSLPQNPITSKGNTLIQVFTSDGGVAYSGFRATWKAV